LYDALLYLKTPDLALTGKTCGQHNTGYHEEVLVFLSGRGMLLIVESDSFPVGGGASSSSTGDRVHQVWHPHQPGPYS